MVKDKAISDSLLVWSLESLRAPELCRNQISGRQIYPMLVRLEMRLRALYLIPDPHNTARYTRIRKNLRHQSTSVLLGAIDRRIGSYLLPQSIDTYTCSLSAAPRLKAQACASYSKEHTGDVLPPGYTANKRTRLDWNTLAKLWMHCKVHLKSQRVRLYFVLWSLN